MFGHIPTSTVSPTPFHHYSMKQAIEEEFILDTLQNYTTYDTYFGLVKKIEDDKRLDKRKASKALARFLSLHPHNISQKTEIIIEHFRDNVMNKIGGKAKAMLVTGSRLHAVRYKKAFDEYLADKGTTRSSAWSRSRAPSTDPDTGEELHRAGDERRHQGDASCRSKFR